MKPIDDAIREAIARVAGEIQDAGYEVNRRGLARDFGVSPQTVARILDGPSARRGLRSEEVAESGFGRFLTGFIAGTIVGWIVHRVTA
jgi:hypothetical protein